jgi:hypothetical protein
MGRAGPSRSSDESAVGHRTPIFLDFTNAVSTAHLVDAAAQRGIIDQLALGSHDTNEFADVCATDPSMTASCSIRSRPRRRAGELVRPELYERVPRCVPPLPHLARGRPPAQPQPRIEFESADPPAIRRDQYGNALGGIRLPDCAVPIGKHCGGRGGDIHESMVGCGRPFTAAELLVGIDESAGMLAATSAAVAAADLRVSRLEDPLPEGDFDLVVLALAVTPPRRCR